MRHMRDGYTPPSRCAECSSGFSTSRNWTTSCGSASAPLRRTTRCSLRLTQPGGNGVDGGNGITQRNGETEPSVSLLLCVIPLSPSSPFARINHDVHRAPRKHANDDPPSDG